jgi:hypothetical protein
MNTPVLLLLYNRFNYTKRLIDNLSKIKPKKIFISIDGPVDNVDISKIENIKHLIKKKINWKCKIRTKINIKNLGCKKAVSEGISWFFNQVKYGIILEDDILPSKFFFNFCTKLLLRFNKNKNISMITGFNPLSSNNCSDLSYFPSNNFPIWGWATWQDRWKKYSSRINNKCIKKIYIKQKKEIGILESIFNYNKFISSKYHWRDTWDIQWVFLCMKLNTYCITPNNNLIFNQDDKYFKIKKIMFNKKYKLIHTKYFFLNKEYDKELFNKFNKKHLIKIILKNYVSLIKNKFKFFINSRIN